MVVMLYISVAFIDTVELSPLDVIVAFIGSVMVWLEVMVEFIGCLVVMTDETDAFIG